MYLHDKGNEGYVIYYGQSSGGCSMKVVSCGSLDYEQIRALESQREKCELELKRISERLNEVKQRIVRG